MKQFREGIIYIQREIRKTKIMYMAKFETLKKMWILQLTDMQIKCLAVRDKKSREFIKDSQNIKEEIRDALLMKFLE